jgi:hypothetical protein
MHRCRQPIAAKVGTASTREMGVKTIDYVHKLLLEIERIDVRLIASFLASAQNTKRERQAEYAQYGGQGNQPGDESTVIAHTGGQHVAARCRRQG